MQHRDTVAETRDNRGRVNPERRRFLAGAGMGVAVMRAGLFGRLRDGGAPSGVDAAAQKGDAARTGRASREVMAIGKATQWLNSPRLMADQLTGRVILVDFWTYTCINWLRSLPYVRAWARKYRDRLTVVGVHTPEFPFEHNVDNVRRALRQMNVDYPTVIDNDYAIWRAFDNHYWPALYLLDAKGHIRHHQFGEGEYAASERAIQRCLTDAGASGLTNDLVTVEGAGLEAPADWRNLQSPETYVGYERGGSFASPDGVRDDQAHAYRAASRLGLNQWSLSGTWTIGRQATTLNEPGGTILYRFHARDMHLVMGPSRAGASVRFRLTIDGQPPVGAHGLDVDEAGNGTAKDQRLYQLIRQTTAITDRTVAIEFLDSGVDAFSFTFG